MISNKAQTLIMLAKVKNYSKTAKLLSLTQPAVTHQIKQLEEEYQVKIFHNGRKTLTLTQEGEIMLQYAHQLDTLDKKLRQALEDSKSSIRRFKVGITATVSEYIVSQLFVTYCSEHPEVKINIIIDNIKNIYNMLQTFELDWAIVEGELPNQDYVTVLLDTDYLCLVVSPKHPLAKRSSVELSGLKKERFILRSPDTSTRQVFEEHLLRHGENIKNFNIIIEIDNIATIKELVEADLGVTIMAHSACREEEVSGRLVIVPIRNFNMSREVNMVYHCYFEHTSVLDEIRNIYLRGPKTLPQV